MQVKYDSATESCTLIHRFYEGLSFIDTMQYISHTPTTNSYHGGGRISSPKLRASLEQSEEFFGLEENTNRYDLLLLVKKAGKAAGFTPRMIELLDYYMAFTRDIDWEEGSSPIVYQSLARTALDLDVSERQIQKLEKALFEVGALTWHDSGNHRRYGQRCEKTGEILYAYGVDLTPLAYLKDELSQKLAEKKAHQQAWLEKKRQISWYRRQIRAMIAEQVEQGADAAVIKTFENRYEKIAVAIRTHMGISRLDELLEEHKELYKGILEILETDQKTHLRTANESNDPKLSQKSSCSDEQKDAYYKSTTYQKSNKLDSNSTALQKRGNETCSGSSNEPVRDDKDKILETGLQHISIAHALNAASGRLKERLPLKREEEITWSEFVESAYNIKSELNISQKSWGQACQVLGRNGAAICILLTDHASQRIDDPVLKPAGYFNAMINRAREGELHLHNSIFGILSREGIKA